MARFQRYKHELDVFCAALMFYTRIPIPKWATYDPDHLNQATKYFPLIGWIVGGGCALVFWLGQLVMPITVSVILALIIGVLITGAFHEDGFADVCDGFGGGWTTERILEIMKDSRVGVYGSFGLFLLFFSQYHFLIAINPHYIPALFLAVNASSRLAVVTFVFTHDYVRLDEKSKAKPIAKVRPSVSQVVIASVFGLAPFVFLPLKFLLILVPIAVMRWRMASFFNKWIGGYTGDCLGATQQLCAWIGFLAALIISEL